MDYQGVHYDATRPSDLEQMLQTLPIPPLLLARAAAFRERLVASGITRYGVGNGSWSRPKRTQQVILVPGQLEWDASLRLGNSTVRTNMALLQAVRQANPSAYVVYKPHPDVVAGLRRRDFGERAARTFCNEIVGDVDMGALLRAVNEVHVMTSLTGFEALLRRKVVFCYGMPFYAGWGLTKDLQVNPRRTRQLRLDELVAAALLLYPMYISRSNGARDTPERAVEELLAWRDAAPATLSEWRRRWRGGVRRPENPESSAIHGISDSRCDHPIETTRTFGRTPARTAKS
jgi:capsular polysaccharide export protein